MNDDKADNLQFLPPLSDSASAEIEAIAVRYRAANGVMMKAVNFAAGGIESSLEKLPDTVKGQIEQAVKSALELSYNTAGRTAKSKAGMSVNDHRTHKAVATLSGVVGGLGGLPTALLELPVTTTLIFRAIQKIASSYGFDPEHPETRIECIKVFGSGSPLASDDGVNTAFIGARVTISGTALQKLIATIAPRFAALISQKLAAQAVPLLGAVAGAGVNYAFMGYFQEMAHVRFGLLKVAMSHDPDAVLQEFTRLAAHGKSVKKRA